MKPPLISCFILDEHLRIEVDWTKTTSRQEIEKVVADLVEMTNVILPNNVRDVLKAVRRRAAQISDPEVYNVMLLLYHANANECVVRPSEVFHRGEED